MPFMSLDDAELWDLCPENMQHAIQGGVTGLAYFPLGELKDNPATVVALRMGPGCVLPRHGHDCYRFEIVVRGTLDVGERVLTVGDIMVSEPNKVYGPHVAGPEGCTTFEIFSNHTASHVVLFDLPRGRVECDVTTQEGLHKLQEAMREDAKSGAQA